MGFSTGEDTHRVSVRETLVLDITASDSVQGDKESSSVSVDAEAHVSKVDSGLYNSDAAMSAVGQAEGLQADSAQTYLGEIDLAQCNSDTKLEAVGQAESLRVDQRLEIGINSDEAAEEGTLQCKTADSDSDWDSDSV